MDINLTLDALFDNRARLLQDANQAICLSSALVPGSCIADSYKALSIVNDEVLRNQTGVELYSTFGVHPYNAYGTQVPSDVKLEILQGLQNDRVVAVGECGLDASPGFPPMEDQVAWFRAQLEIACESQMPLVLHERKAHKEFVDCLNMYNSTLPSKLLVHCFTGNEDELQTYLNMGCYISVSGYICRKNKEGSRFRKMLKAVNPPANRLLIETDAPYMNFPGCRKLTEFEQNNDSPNIPSSLLLVAETLATTLDRDLHQLCSDSFHASCEFLGLPSRGSMSQI